MHLRPTKKQVKYAFSVHLGRPNMNIHGAHLSHLQRRRIQPITIWHISKSGDFNIWLTGFKLACETPHWVEVANMHTLEVSSWSSEAHKYIYQVGLSKSAHSQSWPILHKVKEEWMHLPSGSWSTKCSANQRTYDK